MRILLTLCALSIVAAMQNQLSFNLTDESKVFLITKSGHSTPIFVKSTESEALHVAVKTFAEDIERVSGVKPKIFTDDIPAGTESAIVVSTITGGKEKRDVAQSTFSTGESLAGQWESYSMKVESGGNLGVKQILSVTGSDKVSLLWV